MRIYVSGPMRGLPGSNYAAFRKASDILRAMGHDCLDPSMSFEGEEGLDRTVYLRHDIQLILCCDAVVVIDEWDSSPGARFEVAEAWQIGIPVLEIDESCSPPKLREVKQTIVTIPAETQYHNKLPLLGLSGYAHAGKDEVAKALIDYGWKRIAFADPLKEIATEIGWSGRKDEVGRRLLQNLGFYVRECLDPYAWVNRAEQAIDEAYAPVVVTDVRFPNEIQMIRRRGGKLIRIVRPGTGPVNEHASEHSVSDEDCDMVIINDGSILDLRANVIRAVDSLGLLGIS